MKHKTWVIAAAATAFFTSSIAPAVARATPKQASSSQQLTLDSYFPWNRDYTPPVSPAGVVRKHTYEVASVSGTFSYYSAINYYYPQRPWKLVCGAPLSAPEYPGSLGGGGPVGFDAEFVFARPWKVQKCSSAHLPVRWGNFQMNTGKGWQHPQILGGLPTVPSASHSYDFAVVGDDAGVQFRLADVLTRDNYGLLKISLRPATTADCGSFAAFGFPSQIKCVQRIASNA